MASSAFKRGLVGASNAFNDLANNSLQERAARVQSDLIEKRTMRLAKFNQGIRQEDATFAQGLAESGPKPPIKRTASSSNAREIARLEGLAEGTPEFNKRVSGLMARPSGGTQITLDQGEKPFLKELGKKQAQQFDIITTAGDQGQSDLDLINTARAIDVESGLLEPLKLQGSRILEAFGVDPATAGLEKAKGQEAFNGVMSRQVLKQMTEQKGPQTDQDRRFIANSLASLSKSPQANEFLLNTSEAVARRKVEQAAFFADTTSREDFTQRRKDWAKFKSDNKMVSRKTKNPQTGLPMFYYEFLDQARIVNPNKTDEEIQALWRQVQ